MAEDSTKQIVQSLVINFLIALMKVVAAVFTKSGVMLAEALHSFADCGNQGLLLVGLRQSRKPPDERHPLGYGRAMYFWSFMVALLLFSGGGMFSLYEGIHKIRHPEPVERVWLGALILGGSLLMEGYATLSNIKELNLRRGKQSFLRYLVDTKDSALVVVFGENSAAVLGLGFALVALAAAYYTGDATWDGVGSTAIGVVLVGVAIFLAREVQSLLLGESANPEIESAAREIVEEMRGLEKVLSLTTVQQGPGEVLVAIKVSFEPKIDVEDVCRLINDFEAKLRAKRPEVRWCFVEPDLPPT